MSKKKEIKSAMTEDQEWIREHFTELVDNYAGKYVAVANCELVAVGESPKEVRDVALRKYPHINPSVLLVPHEEDFVCAL